MTTVVQLPVRRDGRVPGDTFAVRLAIVRAEMGWNYVQAGKATGIGPETWRLWEKRERHCMTMEATCRLIAAKTGFSYEWLMVGGSLAVPEPPDTDPRVAPPTNPCLSVVPRTVSSWDRPVSQRVATAA